MFTLEINNAHVCYMYMQYIFQRKTNILYPSHGRIWQWHHIWFFPEHLTVQQVHLMNFSSAPCLEDTGLLLSLEMPHHLQSPANKDYIICDIIIIINKLKTIMSMVFSSGFLHLSNLAFWDRPILLQVIICDRIIPFYY